MDAIQKAIAEAQTAAGEVANLPATVTETTGTSIVPRGKTFTMDDLMSGGLTVDDWIQVKEFGLVLKSADDLLLPTLEVIIDLEAVQPHRAIRFGNPAKYYRTYDGVTCVQGGTWAQAVRTATGTDPRAYEYNSVDIPMTLVSDVRKPGKGGEIVQEAGTKVGHSTAPTAWKGWKAFYQDCQKAGLSGPVRVELSTKQQTNAAGNKWGVIQFNLLGSAEDLADAA